MTPSLFIRKVWNRLNPYNLTGKLICSIRSYWYSRLIDEGGGRIILSKPFIKFKIVKGRGAKFILRGDLLINRHLGGSTITHIKLDPNSTLQIDGDFMLGHGNRIYLYKNSILQIGGRRNESVSGITADSLIMVYSNVKIGIDFICAWGVFISDSDWHIINGKPHNKDVSIGDHVWIANSSSILKGSIINDNCIVASHSKLGNSEYPSSSLIGGMPGTVLKSNVSWNRDIE